jgi:DtxR family Mn-dependent transcriptional regulator
VPADFERKLVERLGSSHACPHGNIVGMDSPEARRRRGLKPLEEARGGLVVVSLFERDRKLLEYLDGAGIRPGVRLEVVSSAPGLLVRLGRTGLSIFRTASNRNLLPRIEPYRREKSGVAR